MTSDPQTAGASRSASTSPVPTSSSDATPTSASAPSRDVLEVDVIVLGGGPVGENVAQYAIEGTGLSAAIVEGERMGGECSYWACMPSKALLRPLDVRAAAEHLPGITTPEIDVEALLARRDDWVSHYDDTGQVQWAEGAGLTVVRGHGALSGEREVTVRAADGQGADGTAAHGAAADGTVADGAPRVLRARRAVVLATGSEPVIPAPYAALAPWTSRDATGVQEVPGRLLIVGGGVVACEAATWMRALGSEVTMLVRGDRLLASAEPEASEHVRTGLEAIGVRVLTGTSAEDASRDGVSAGADGESGIGRLHGGEVRVRVAGTAGAGADGEVLTADEILVATGRRPRLQDVGLEAVGLSPADVTGAALPDWLYAVGDASGEAPLTHWGKYRARVIGEEIRDASLADVEPTPPPEAVAEGRAVPQVVFTDPQVASVGLTERASREAGFDVEIAQVPFEGAAGSALLRDDASGVAKIVVDARTHRLLGATFAGPDAAEIVHAATVAIVGEVPVDVLRHAVPSYPTASELWLRLLEELPREYRHAAPRG
ncbi:NAD(P)/FAD-dependent oxidoreductase [Brachybacterium halotolerans subsp. kimchii]|uniref:dihydrolipoyl dehydrogenase family protein n=1 Tax=Brachybacterium halotolerans TaxID=2795215 RepID=UPI001E5F1B46|nr:NAD(P)/FAD-dependent oxidoreductase [Brachybacterium halotolerans]UEJ84262.1 NAD(P)/FAD-dependent oxidoreductase [Brachybacterium halotolerans subsp. kimchii]